MRFHPFSPHRGTSVEARLRSERVTWLLGYGACLALTAVVGVIGMGRYPTPYPLALLCVVVGCFVMLFRPVVGIYMIGFLTFIGDYAAVASFPFAKNMSSKESMLFVSPALNVSPLELWIAMLLFGWMLQMAGSGRWTIRRGRLLGPIMAFSFFLITGLAVGLSRGGDSKIALSELRPMTYLALLYPVVTNMLTRRQQYVRLYNAMLAGIVVNALLSYRHVRMLTPTERANPESIMQHSTPLIMNVVIVMLVSLRLFHGGTRLKRWALAAGLLPMLYVYLEVKRRAAIVGLLAGGLLLFAVLFWTNRRRFRRLAPIVFVLGMAYTAVFWSSSSTLGFPAQAAKTVIAPSSVSDRDRASNAYRDIETYDIKQTIRSSPLTGIGFGKPFLRPLALPAIADFVLARYVTHNSMLWVWMKMGAAGFVAMLYLFGTAMRTGARAALRTPRGEYAALTATSAAFVLMFAVYTYVDISWDAKSMVFLAIAMAQIDSVALVPEEAEADAEAAPVGEADLPLDDPVELATSTA